MYRILLWLLKLSCLVCQVDSENLHKTLKPYKAITPETFGH